MTDTTPTTEQQRLDAYAQQRLVDGLNAYERETIVNASDGDDTVRIWTAQRRHITALRRRPGVTEVATGHHGTTEWAEFIVPADRWDAARAVTTPRRLSDEQRQQIADRFRQGRERAGAAGRSTTATGEHPSAPPHDPSARQGVGETTRNDATAEGPTTA